MADEPASVHALFDRLRGPDDRAAAEAAQELWNQFGRRVQEFARQRIPNRLRRVTDEEDVAQSAFHSLFARAREGQFDVRDRDALWTLLAVITSRKVGQRVRRDQSAKRGGGRIADEPPNEELEAVQASEPGPVEQAQWEDSQTQLLERLDPSLRETALLKLAGHTDAEVADLTGCSVRTVERRLMVIRKIWERELQRDAE